MKRLLLALALLLWPGAAFARFAPVDGAALRYSVVEERGANRFTSERRIVFRKAEQGYTAELTIVSSSATGDNDVGAMAQRVMRALVGRTIVYALNDAGTVVAIEHQDELMAVVVEAFGAMGSAGKDDSPTRDAVAARAATMLASMPPAMQRTLLASLLTPVIGGELSEAQPGEGPVTLPARSPAGQSAELTGRQIVTRAENGRLVIDVDVSGPAPGAMIAAMPGAPPADPAAVPMMRIVQQRQIESATGLVVVNTRRSDSWLSTRPNDIVTVRTTARLTPL